MPLNLRILLPIILLAAMSTFSMLWLSYTSIRSAEDRTASATLAMEFVSRSAEMAERLRAAKAELKVVLDMTRLMDVDEIWSFIGSETEIVSKDITWLLANADDEKMQAELEAAHVLLEEWVRDASILLGKTQSSEIPTAEKISRIEDALTAAFASSATEAQAKVQRTSAASLQEMRATMLQSAMFLFVCLSLVLVGSIFVARRLSKEVSDIAEQLLGMADKKDATGKDRDVLLSARSAVKTLQAALDERTELEKSARRAEAERREIAEKDKVRAESERKRIAEENEAAKERAEAERRRAESERKRIAEENEAAKERAEAQKRRAEQSAELEKEITRVVDAARDGELSSRIDRSFEEPSLNEVSHGINVLLETIASSISQAQVTQQKLARGDLTARFEGEQRGVFQSLQRDINQTAEQFQDAMQQISTSSQDILSDATGISGAAKNLAERTERTAENTERTTKTVERVSGAAREMATNAEESSKLATASIQNVESSEASMKNAMQAMDEIASYSKQISTVVSVINDISFQTNLLALNAGVEAARAGSAGSGFAVVASEVRALAQRSTESAKEIEALITQSGERVDAGVEVVKRTGEALDAVSRTVHEISQRVSSIAKEAGTQSSEIQEIQASLTEVDQATQSNAAMFEETTAASESLTAAADSLANLSSRFDSGTEVDAFRLSA